MSGAGERQGFRATSLETLRQMVAANVGVTLLPVLAAQLYEGMAYDLARIAAGEPLPALGEGSVCGWCDARGLCRKDFWKT